MKISKKFLWVLTGLALLIAAWFLLGKTQTAGPEAASNRPGQVSENQDAPKADDRPTTLTEDEKQAALAAQMEILPKSLQDVPRPGQLDVDENGALIINGKIRPLFDYYLSALGEEGLTLIRQRVDFHIADLPDTARQEAMGIFDNYVAYLSAIDVLNGTNSGTVLQSSNVEEVIRMKENVLALRQQYFSPEVALVFFAQDDAWDNYVIERLKINSDELLSQDEKTSAIEALDRLLPPEFLEAKQGSDRLNNYRSLTDYARDNPDADIDLDTVRRDSFGAEAANRLSTLDQKRSEWDDRVTAYRKDRDQVLEFQIQGSGAYTKALTEVRERHFQGAELRRIAALDEIEKLNRDKDE